MYRLAKYLNNKSYAGWRVATVLILCLALLAHFVAWERIIHNNKISVSQNFNNLVEADVSALQNRFEVYADTLYSSRALFLARTNVSRQDWTTFVSAQNFKYRYPGVNGISYVTVIDRSQTADLTARLNANRLPSETKPINIYPTTTNSQLAVITYLAPEDTDQTVIGYDMYSSQLRQQVLNAARDTSQPQASPPLSLVSDSTNAPPSLLEIMPVYKPSMNIGTIAERRAALQGYVVLSLHSKPFLDSIFDTGSNQQLAVTAVTNTRVIYRFGTAPTRSIQKIVNLNVAGQKWEVTFAAPNSFQLSRTAQRASAVVIFNAIPFTVLLCLLVYYALRFETLRKHHTEHHN